MPIKPRSQKDVDAQALKEGLATGSDQVGGQNRLDRPARMMDDEPVPDDMNAKFAKRGIKLHDKGPDTWGLKKVPRYEHE